MDRFGFGKKMTRTNSPGITNNWNGQCHCGSRFTRRKLGQRARIINTIFLLSACAFHSFGIFGERTSKPMTAARDGSNSKLYSIFVSPRRRRRLCAHSWNPWHERSTDQYLFILFFNVEKRLKSLFIIFVYSTLVFFPSPCSLFLSGFVSYSASSFFFIIMIFNFSLCPLLLWLRAIQRLPWTVQKRFTHLNRFFFRFSCLSSAIIEICAHCVLLVSFEIF